MGELAGPALSDPVDRPVSLFPEKPNTEPRRRQVSCHPCQGPKNSHHAGTWRPGFCDSPSRGGVILVQTANILYIINRKHGLHGLHIDRVSAEEDKPMPWKETCTMDQRMLFIVDYLSYTKKGLCRHYGISRPTGDKWIDRYRTHGREGLDDLSRRPGYHPDTTAPEIVERIIATKLAHQSFGPKKVMDRLRALEPDEVWPADSTAGKILKRNHLVRERRQRRRVPPDPRALVHCNAPAQSWSADFKGDVPLANGKRCYPLTLTDNHSRFILQCRALSHPTTDAVKPWFEWVFREYGLPETLRTGQRPALCLGGCRRPEPVVEVVDSPGHSPRAHPPGQAQ